MFLFGMGSFGQARDRGGGRCRFVYFLSLARRFHGVVLEKNLRRATKLKFDAKSGAYFT